LVNEASDENEFAALANWSNQHNEPQWAVLAGKAAQQHGYIGLRAAYPILAKNIRAEFDARIDPALAHGLIRQESEFDVSACSHSGALGLMQLMPATAKVVARKIGTRYSQAALTNQPMCNVQFGSFYIADQLENFGNSYLAIAAYNAGPGNVHKWLMAYGDPRRDANVDMIDWIETIPSYETRNYVQRVTENKNVYAALFAQIAQQQTNSKFADR
jgi:soluble lytic murein transglycosylase